MKRLETHTVILLVMLGLLTLLLLACFILMGRVLLNVYASFESFKKAVPQHQDVIKELFWALLLTWLMVTVGIRELLTFKKLEVPSKRFIKPVL